MTIRHLTVDLTNPDVNRNGRIVLQKDMLTSYARSLWRGTVYQRIGLQNHGEKHGEVSI